MFTIKYPKVSVVVVNHNGKRFLQKLLESLKKTRYPNFEIIFVDAASEDGSVKFVKKNFKEVRIIENKIARGFPIACNDGIKASDTDSKYFVALNEDMYVNPDWLSHLVKISEADKKIGVVGYSRLVPGSNKIEMLGHKCVNENLAKFNKIGAGKYLSEFSNRETIEADFCLGLIKISILKKIGLNDEKFPLMYDDVDLCKRIKNAGYKIVVAPKSKVWHYGSQTLKKASVRRIYYTYRSRLRYVLKHNRGFNKIFYADILLLIYFFKILKFSFQGKFNLSWAIIRGIFWNIKNLGDYF